MEKNSSYDAIKIYFPRTQVVFMILTCITFALFLYKPLKEFRSDDVEPKVFPQTQQKTEQYKKEGKIVHTHLAIYDAPKFEGNIFKFKGYIIFTYDPKAISYDVIKEFDIQKGDLKKSAARIIKHDNGTESAHFSIKVDFSMHVDYKDYPLDDHRLAFAIVNAFAQKGQFLFYTEKDDFLIEEEYAMNSWKDVGRSVTAGHLEKPFKYGIVEYPAILYTIDYAHDAIRQTSIILLPLFLVFFLTTFGLSLNPHTLHSTIIAISTSGISAIMAYRYVIESISPKVGYFMLTDYLFFLFFFTIFINFILSMFIEEIPHKALKYILVGLYLWVLLFCGYFLLFWL